MYLKENVQKLREIGLTDEEIKKIRKGRWLFEYCKPDEIFLLKIAYLIKSGRSPAYEIIKGDRKAVEHFERRLRNLVDLFALSCTEAAERYMREHFEEFLYIPRNQLGYCHFKVLTDFFLTFRNSSRVLCSLVDFRVQISEVEDVFLYSLSMHGCGVMWMGKGKKMWFFAGPLIKKDPKIIEDAVEFADRVFTSEWWEKLSGFLPFLRETHPSLRSHLEKIEKLHEIKEWFDALKAAKPVLEKLKQVPGDFMSQIITMYVQLLEEYMEM